MTLREHTDSAADARGRSLNDAGPSLTRARRDRPRVGLVNNMPDAALLTTERQFARLLGAGTELQLFFLPEIERGAGARLELNRRYKDIDALEGRCLDGLIVTGAEPRHADLRQEPYWPSFQRLVAWAEANTRSTVWSCLAAHAAVLQLDGIERRPLARKCIGVFERTTAGDDPLFRDVPERSFVPHSRHNTLDEDDLLDAGYGILSRVGGEGPDAFVREGRSRFVFLQGHPEYDADSLALEFQRDFNRYLRGQSTSPPTVPAHLFDTGVESAITALVARAEPCRTRALGAELGRLLAQTTPTASWRPSAERFYANWLNSLDVLHHAPRRYELSLEP